MSFIASDTSVIPYVPPVVALKNVRFIHTVYLRSSQCKQRFCPKTALIYGFLQVTWTVLCGVYVYFFLPWHNSPYRAKAPLSRIHDHTQTHHTRQDSSGRVTSPTQRPVPNNTQHSQQTDIHVPGGIQTRNPGKRAAANPRLRPCGHWDQRMCVCVCVCVCTHTQCR